MFHKVFFFLAFFSGIPIFLIFVRNKRTLPSVRCLSNYTLNDCLNVNNSEKNLKCVYVINPDPQNHAFTTVVSKTSWFAPPSPLHIPLLTHPFTRWISVHLVLVYLYWYIKQEHRVDGGEVLGTDLSYISDNEVHTRIGTLSTALLSGGECTSPVLSASAGAWSVYQRHQVLD